MTAAAPVLNLNNEVVKMRKDVKKVKALTIRKLIRHSAKLKSKKGTEEQVLKNQRRAQRLLEEILTMKRLKPDDVTKTALREDINFDSILNKADSTVENRAVTRLVTHPLIKQKISAIKDAVQKFKETRMNQAIQGFEQQQPSLPSIPAKSINQEAENKPKQGKAKQKRKIEETKQENKVLDSPVLEMVDTKINVIAKQKRKTEVNKLENKVNDSPVVEMVDKQNVIAKQKRKPEVNKLENKVIDSPVVEMVDKQNVIAKQKSKPEVNKLENKVIDSPVVEMVDKEIDLGASSHSNEESPFPATPQAQVSQAVPEVQTEKTVLQSSSEKATVQNKTSKVKQNIPDQKVPSTNESDSSDLEDSDQEDKEYFDDSTEERFLKQTSGFEDSDSGSEDDFFIGKVRQTKKKKSSRHEDHVMKDKLPQANLKPSVSGTEEKKASAGPKNVKLESVFCTSLSKTKQKSSFMKRESKFPPVGNKKTVFPQASTLSRKPQHVKAVKQQNQNKVQEQTLHPSWEASRKRKEQSQIAVFQGKKTVFGD
ncbi:serum response factor-binding protein 1 [Hyla sarda]|uniref:serum response factor-binding protein 1 n=1 Tax=Hyla sarda TaxID=327740 RepID=UPI0024C279FF|nr:serum response factor-binding protein 1 [Hyla sarda]